MRELPEKCCLNCRHNIKIEKNNAYKDIVYMCSISGYFHFPSEAASDLTKYYFVTPGGKKSECDFRKMIKQKQIDKLLAEEINRAIDLDIDLMYVNPSVVLCSLSNKYAEFSPKHKVIRLNKDWVKMVKDTEEIRTVLCHELMHAILGSVGHDRIWRMSLRKMRRAYDYLYGDFHLHEKPYSKERIEIGALDGHTKAPEFAGGEGYKYTIICDKCGYEWHYKRLTNAVKSPKDYYCVYCSHGQMGKSTLRRIK